MITTKEWGGRGEVRMVEVEIDAKPNALQQIVPANAVIECQGNAEHFEWESIRGKYNHC